MEYLNKKRQEWEASKPERQKLLGIRNFHEKLMNLGFDEDNLSNLTYEEIVESEDLLEGRK